MRLLLFASVISLNIGCLGPMHHLRASDGFSIQSTDRFHLALRYMSPKEVRQRALDDARLRMDEDAIRDIRSMPRRTSGGTLIVHTYGVNSLEEGRTSNYEVVVKKAGKVVFRQRGPTDQVPKPDVTYVNRSGSITRWTDTFLVDLPYEARPTCDVYVVRRISGVRNHYRIVYDRAAAD